MPFNIVLVGFMGTGKTSVGKILSRKTGRPVLDVDSLIEARLSRRISDIFEKEGEAHFRRLEKETIADVAQRNSVIITTGGGAVLDGENIAALKANGRLVALIASENTIYERVKNSKKRPLLKGDTLDQIRKLLMERKRFYDQADYQVNTDGLTAEETAQQILRLPGLLGAAS